MKHIESDCRELDTKPEIFFPSVHPYLGTNNLRGVNIGSKF